MASILPAFDRWPEAGSIVGRLVTGYGELEYELAMCVSLITQNTDMTFKVIYRASGEMQRVLVADALGRRALPAGNYRTLFEQAIAAMHHCRKIRNQYAHCNWGDDDKGLWFTNPEEPAQENENFMSGRMQTRRADVPLLKEQEAYFCYVRDCFEFLSYAVRARRKEIPTNPKLRAPKSRPGPKLHN